VDVRARYDSDDVAWLSAPDSEVESQWVERKVWCDAREIARQVSGFANGKPPGGLFVLGAERTGEIRGIEGHERAVDERVAELRNLVEGPVGWKERRVPAQNKTLLFLFVPFSENRVVCLSDGTAYRRVGAKTFEMSPEEIREQRDARGELHFEDEVCCPYAEDVLDAELGAAFLEELRARNGLTLPQDLRAAVVNRKLARETERGLHLTNAGILALGRDPTRWMGGARVRFLRFEGTEERFGTHRNVVKDQWFEGGAVPRLIEQFRAFMRTQVREFDYLGPNGLFVHEPEYPEFVWDEAVVNALVHRAYTLADASVFVRVFDDRVEVESPGGFPGTVRPPDRLFSFPRNRNLANALQYLKLVRLAHEGTRRMQQEMAAMGLPPPELEEVKGGSHVRVTLRNDIERRKARTGADDVPRQWREVEEALRDDLAIRRGYGVRQFEQLRARGAIPPASVLRAVTELFRVGQDGDALLQKIVWRLDGLPASLLQPLADELANELIAGRLRRPSVVEMIVPFLAAQPNALEIVLRHLENRKVIPKVVANDEGIAPLFAVLSHAVNASVVPPRDWLARVMRVCERHRGAPEAKRLYSEISGRPLAD
jgi:ATP-dependent DNA helicase RecG